MKISVHVVGRMKAGPERELSARYFDRFAKTAPALGLEWAGISELAESRARSADDRKRDEAQRLHQMIADGTAVLVLDERGKQMSSEAFASTLARMRDDGRRDLCIAIGGPDGHDPELRGAAQLAISFGNQTWPHQLVRVMLAEQLYRAATILSGHPYHRA
ncbi:MAG: 23S rRNA (pseudouridine(1915)-N(3))-methyltransferase RlmH [Rhizobiaceae bacterium]|nr:23S rRNA (pseudouridine(1915)-N(3))-methyltransferase RlmH [Rhizobiaceae bacterium]